MVSKKMEGIMESMEWNLASNKENPENHRKKLEDFVMGWVQDVQLLAMQKSIPKVQQLPEKASRI